MSAASRYALRSLPTLTFFAAIAMIVTAFSAGAETVNKKASEFVRQAWNANEFEIASSQLALENSKSDAVRNFAQTMINDHKKTDADLHAAAASSTQKDKLTIPTALDLPQQDKLNALHNAGAGFDQEYAKAQKDAHATALVLFRDYAKDGDDTALKAFATATIPALEGHQRMADDLVKNIRPTP